MIKTKLLTGPKISYRQVIASYWRQNLQNGTTFSVCEVGRGRGVLETAEVLLWGGRRWWSQEEDGLLLFYKASKCVYWSCNDIARDVNGAREECGWDQMLWDRAERKLWDSHTMKPSYCLSNAIHCMGQNIKSLAACVCVCFCLSVCVCARDLGAKYLEND